MTDSNINIQKYANYNQEVIIEVGNSLKGINLKKSLFNKNLDLNQEKIKKFIDDILSKEGHIDTLYIKDENYFAFIKLLVKNKNVHYLILGEKVLLNKKVDEKKNKEQEAEINKLIKKIQPFIEQYLSNKSFEFKGIILGIIRNDNLFELIHEENLELLKDHFLDLYRQTQEYTPKTSADYDEAMSMENTCNMAWELIQDIIKLNKILKKKNIKANYILIFEEMGKIVELDMKKTIEKLTMPAYKRISKITTTNKKRIIQEYLKLGFDEPNEMIILDLFDKFGLSAKENEINNLLNECIEEMELEEFENQSKKEESKDKNDETNFDSDMKLRFEYLIQRFRNDDNNIKPPKDPEGYTGDNCWVCFDNNARWYKGFRRLCSDCVDVLEGNSDLNKSISNISKIKKEKREFLIKVEKRLKKEAEEREVILKKEKLNKKQLREKNAPLVADYCSKYLSSKDFDFKGIILGIFRNKDIFGLIYENDLDFLQEHFVKLYQQAQEHSPSTSADYDELMSLESTCNYGIQIIEDVKKIKKLLDKKEIKTDYIQIFEEMAQIVEHDMKKTIEKLTIPAYKRISKITTTDKELIIKEYLKLGFDEPNEMIIKDLFDKFGLEYSDSEAEHLLKDCLEEMELEDFENNLGLETKKKIGDFSKLNGHQFEDYLKELFSILGYQVIRTKLSGDQGADLIIKKDEMKSVVQAKKYAGTVTNKAIQEVVASKKHYGADKAMVVTTGTFTKSAIELAKSNKVEIWDKNKLKEIINSINKTSNKSKGFQDQQSLNLKGDTFPAHCPFCDSEIEINVKDLPKKNKQKTLSCPECNVNLGISIPDNFYSCVGCKKEFDTVKERIDHSKLCKKVKERQFNCSHCKKEFTLDDNEFEEFIKKDKLKVECPACKKENVLKK